MTAPESLQRLSAGGRVVEDSLRALGFNTVDRSRTLVETRLPRAHAFDAVMVQNAWTIVPGDEFTVLIASYSRKRKMKNQARRLVARVNLSRTPTIVCLSHYMGTTLAGQGIVNVVTPVTLPIDLLFGLSPRRPRCLDEGAAFVLVPGTVSWYKSTGRIVEIVRAMDEAGLTGCRIVLAGPNDGSGCLESLIREAGDGRVVNFSASRQEMAWLLENAEATFLFSQLESLSLSMGEALWLAPRVFATPLPVHKEVADRVGRQPHWLGTDLDTPEIIKMMQESSTRRDLVRDTHIFEQEWRAAGEAMGLGTEG